MGVGAALDLDYGRDGVLVQARSGGSRPTTFGILKLKLNGQSSQKYARAHLIAARVSISVSESSVRLTGHFSAISRSFSHFSVSRGPSSSSSSWTRSILPLFVSHSSQSFAWILPCSTRTVTDSSGHPLRSAYILTVIAVQLPSAVNR